jgi:hypothetical protein
MELKYATVTSRIHPQCYEINFEIKIREPSESKKKNMEISTAK